LFLFELLSAHEFFIIFRHLPAPSLTLRTPSTGCCFIFKLLNFIGVSLFMGQRRQKHYISISTCLPTSTHFSFRFFRLVYFQLQPIPGLFSVLWDNRCDPKFSQDMPLPFLFLIYFYVLWKFHPTSSSFDSSKLNAICVSHQNHRSERRVLDARR